MSTFTPDTLLRYEMLNVNVNKPSNQPTESKALISVQKKNQWIISHEFYSESSCHAFNKIFDFLTCLNVIINGLKDWTGIEELFVVLNISGIGLLQ